MVVLGLSVLGCGVEMKTDPCQGVSCGEGRCAVVDQAPACLCNQGFVSTGLGCAAIPPADLCASSPCANLTNSLCQVNAGRVSCVCPMSRVEVNGSCVVRTACLPNPCQNAHRTTCEVTSGTSSCRCDPGFSPEGDGCSASPVWTCASQHVDGDAAEADECPTFAKGLSIEIAEQRTIFPAGDHDWFELGVTPGHLFSFSANSTSLPLLIEVFDVTGVQMLASDNRGGASAEAIFVAPLSQTVMVRVRGVRASDTGGYSVRYSDLGVDDYANTVADAITLVPGANPFAGGLQYAGDLDVVKLEVPALTAIRLLVADGGSDLIIEVSRPDGGVRQLTPGELTSITTPDVELLTVTAKARNPRTLGDFSVSFLELGVDDHSDEAAFGTPIASNNVPVPGRFERPQDIDCFSVAQLPDRLYRARWAGANFNPAVSVVLPGGQVVTSNSYSATGLVWQATQSGRAAVRMQSGYSGTPAYSVAVEDLGLDDHSDTVSNATPAAYNVPVAGRLELSDDVDTFSFTGTVGRIIQVTATPTVGTQSNFAFSLTVIGPQGTELASGNSTVGLQISAAGLYKVQVARGGYSYATDLVGYTLTVSDQGVDDHAGTSSGATALTVGTPVTGNIQYAADVDAFAFSGLANHVYEVLCTRGSSPCSVTVKDAVGQVIISTSSSYDAPAFLASTAQRYVVEVNSGSSYSTVLGPYSVTVNDRGLEDHGGTISTATALTLGTAVSGNLGFATDVDAFSFTAVAGNIYSVNAAPANSVRLEVRNASNGVVASSYNSVASFIAPTNGSYFVMLSSYSSVSAYSLTVTDRGVDDHPNTSAGATALTLGTSLAGEIQYQGDVDFFSVPVIAGHHHLATCTNAGGTSCTVTVLTTAGVTIASTSASSGIGFKPPAGATTVNLRVSSSYSSDVFRYQVVVTDLGADDHGDARADATALVINAPAIAGVIETGSDVDAFTISASAGEIIAIDCVVTAGAACAMTVSSPAGGSIASTSNTASARTGFLAASSGSYLVTVRGNSYSSGGTGSYTLAATRGSDDSTSTTPMTLGTPRTGSIDYVGDTDVFSVVLTQGVPVQMLLTSGLQARITAPGGTYVANLYGGYTNQFVPTTSGTHLFTVSSDSYYGTLSSYTLTVQ